MKKENKSVIEAFTKATEAELNPKETKPKKVVKDAKLLLRFSAQDKQALADLAAYNSTSINEMLNRAIKEYLAKPSTKKELAKWRSIH